ncbi:hypothetical protein M427DRAFT_133583 [Gonapodya prolifera JEL478]|uniref:Stabilizer of axonemal microtubules 2 n=1 Tax=Gonapodya prolifera (strain JEL478) TaxID=1344416 RepID=A0A139AK12_GONPJ|nr:hypothetical protein M427DRAFT_133583 [Gonapodya prolifera JEL478]|eukprot:KXS17117.1 hypothetical protein M427DRAFT_133583 [Gonapodya prolifera JEL478]
MCTCGKHKRLCSCGFVTRNPPLDGATEYSKNFKSNDGFRPDRVRKIAQYQPSPDPLESVTENRAQFVPKSLKARATPIIKAPEYQPDRSTFEGVSTSKADYKGIKAPRTASSHKPDEYICAPDSRDFKSVTAASYVEHHLSGEMKPKSAAPPYVPLATAKFNAKTLNQDDFVPWKVQKRQEIRPKPEYEMVPGKLEGETVYHNDYSKKPLQKLFHREPAKYMPSQAKIEGVSTARADFHALPLVPTPSFAPRLKYEPGHEDRDFTSQTHAAYTAKSLEMCEVTKHGGEKTKRDETGHLHFVPTATATVNA